MSFSSVLKLYSILKSMQPIVLLGVAVAAVALVSTGFLNDETWNQFELTLQSLGWGEEMLNSPISHAFVDLEVKKILNDNGSPTDPSDDYFDNVIQSCSFHADKNIDAPPAPFAPGIGTTGLAVNVINDGVIICKMLDDRQLAIAEGKISIVDLGGYVSSDKAFVPIVQCITENGLVESPNCLDVQTPIHFVKLVVEDSLWSETITDILVD